MADEIIENEQDEGQGIDYLSVIQELKAKTVAKEDFEKLKDENKRLLKTLIDGGNITMEKEAPTVDKDALRKELYGSDTDLSNLEYVSKTLQLRQALIDEGEMDPFLPIGKNISPTPDDEKAAQKVADVMQECIEYAQGDSELFTQELMRRTNDVRIRR